MRLSVCASVRLCVSLTFDEVSVDAVPVIARGHNVAVCLPPVTEVLSTVVAAVPRRPLLVLTSDRNRALECARASGLSDATVAGVGTPPAPYPGGQSAVCVGAADALDLLGHSSLRVAEFAAIVLAWPEELDEDGLAALGAVMAEADREAQRVIVTAVAGEATDQLVDRYAFKAMTYGFVAHAPVGPAGFVVAPASRLPDWMLLLREALAGSAATRPVATCPRSHEEAAALAAEGPPVLVLAPYQVAWARTVFQPLTPMPLPGGTAAHQRATERSRADLSRLLATQDLGRELLVLGPLFDAHDPAMVAAAALRLARGAGAGHPAAGGGAPEPLPAQAIPAYARLWVGIGRKDGVKPGDLVGALVNEAKVPADAVGRIDVRDLFCLVDMRAEVAEQAVRALTGTTIRGRRITARLDRGPGPGARPPRRA